MNRARQLRLDARCGLLDAAEQSGISTRTLKKIESGEMVNAESLGRLADFYKVQPSELLSPAIFGSPTTGEAA